MATIWTISIDWDRNDNFTGAYDDVTDRVIRANWSLGFQQPYSEVPDNPVLRLTLDNSDKRYSPEFSGSPLYGKLASFRPVRIQSNNGTLRTHWTGWIEDIQPTVNQYGERTVEIKAAGPGQFFSYTDTDIELQENKRTDEIIELLLQEVIIPPALTKAWILGDSDYGKLGSSTYLPDVTIDYSLQAGKTTLAYAADNWVRQDTEDGKRDTFNVYRAIQDTVAAEQGRFFFDRSGQAVFWNRHHLLVPPSNPTTFDDTMTDLEYSFAALDEFKTKWW